MQRKFPWTSKIMDDLLSEGMQTLWKCVEIANEGKHDESRSRWTTYTTRAVRNNILRKAQRCSTRNQRFKTTFNEDTRRIDAIVAPDGIGFAAVEIDDDTAIAYGRVQVCYTGSLFGEADRAA